MSALLHATQPGMYRHTHNTSTTSTVQLLDTLGKQTGAEKSKKYAERCKYDRVATILKKERSQNFTQQRMRSPEKAVQVSCVEAALELQLCYAQWLQLVTAGTPTHRK